MRRNGAALVFGAAIAVGGCYAGASADDEEAATEGGTGGSSDDGGVPDDVDPNTVAPPLVPRLTDTQYRYTLIDVLGVELTEEENEWLPPDVPVEGAYSTSTDGQFFNTQYVLGYARIARSLTERLDPYTLLEDFGGCVDTGSQCLEAFVTGLGLRLFRRPLSDEEIDAHLALAGAIAAADETDDTHVVRGIVQAMLQAPQFLYRLEAETEGEPDSLRTVNGYELASRLSYFLWQSAPDPELLAFAAGPQGDGDYDAAALADQVDRMIADPRFSRSRSVFWGDYSLASVSAFGSVEQQLATEYRDSLMATFDRLSGVDAPAQPLSAIFDGQQVVMTPAVAELAGIAPQQDGLAVYEVGEAEQRLGVVTHPAFIAAVGTTSFVGRGVFMTERLLCQHIAPPPSDANTAERIMDTAQQTADMTPREASEFRFGLEPLCLSCHTQFEPVAYAFERYDMQGRYGLTDAQGRDLYSDGTLPPFGERPEIAFATAPELLTELAGLPSTHECFVENMMEYATGASRLAAPVLREAALSEFEADGLTFDALVGAIATNPRLTLKRVAAP